MKKSIAYFVMALCLTLLMCGKTFAQGAFSPSTTTITLPARIFVPSNAAVGKAFWTSPTIASTMTKGGGGSTAASMEIDTPTQTATNTYFPTGVAGVGLVWRMKLTAQNFSTGRDISLGTGSYGSGSTGINNANTGYRQEVYVQLVRTSSAVPSGRLSFATGGLLRWRYNCTGSCTHWNISLSGSPSIEAAPVCAVKTPNQTVAIPKVTASSFSGQGSTSPPQGFSIDLSCSGGVSGSRTNAYVTLSDATTPANRSNVLTLSGGTEKAAGIGIQIKQGGNIVSYGPDSEDMPNVNQWLGGTINQSSAAETIFKIPLTASYVQTAATQTGVTVGTADAKVLFNITYN